jgi:[ribosomal protein S5]-alanine N-acetyltransferase
MVFRNIFARLPAAASGERVYLRPPHRSDFHQWAALRDKSRAFLQPWEPVWAGDELSRSAFRSRVGRALNDARDGSAHVFFIFDRNSHDLLGGITLGHIRYGVAMNGHIGYWMGEQHAGKGLMQDAVLALVAYGFDRLGLHRLEAACIPGNERSIRVLEKTGFTREGLLKSYLKINGEWQDHLLFARISGSNG